MAERYKFEGARELPVFFEQWRLSKDWTQQELADRMDTSKQTVSRIETGAREWGKGYIEAFGHVVGCHPLAPLLSPPRPDLDVSAFLHALEAASGASAGDMDEAAKILRSLARKGGPQLRRVAKAPPPNTQKENSES